MRTNHTPEFVLLYHTLQLRRVNGESWESIARSFNSPKITRGYIYNMIKRNSEPEHNHIREALGLPALVPFPACPICGATHTHAHGEVVYPAGTLTYDGATQEVKPIETKPSKRRDTRIRLHATVEQALYEAVKGQANFEGTTMDAIVYRGVMLAIYDYQAIMNRQPAPVLHGQNGARGGA